MSSSVADWWEEEEERNFQVTGLLLTCPEGLTLGDWGELLL